MMILMTFTLVFVVVYMYYTIKDVKRIYGEVKKNTQDIQALQSLTNDVKNMKGTIEMMNQGMLAQSQFNVCSIPFPDMSQQVFVPPPPPQHVSDIKDDAESVATEDIKKLVRDDDDDDENEEIGVVDDVGDIGDIVNETAGVVVEPVQTQVISEESLKKLKFEELKDVCKKMGISIKGTREALISRILTEKNVS